MITKINNGIISTSLFQRKHSQQSLSPLHQLSSYAHENCIVFFHSFSDTKDCTDRKDFIKHSNELVTHFLHIGYPIRVILKQLDKGNKVHRSSLSSHGEKTIDIHILLVQSYHPTIVSTNKSVIKQWKLHSNINSAEHLFCN